MTRFSSWCRCSIWPLLHVQVVIELCSNGEAEVLVAVHKILWDRVLNIGSRLTKILIGNDAAVSRPLELVVVATDAIIMRDYTCLFIRQAMATAAAVLARLPLSRRCEKKPKSAATIFCGWDEGRSQNKNAGTECHRVNTSTPASSA
jgi:hypothetical protein